MLNKLKKYQNLNIRSLIDQGVRDNEKAILDLNRDQMYDQGTVDVTRPGGRLQYSRVTVPLKKKHAKYKKTEFITLKWDGDFHDSLFIEYRSNEFVIKSSDPKWILSLEPQPRFENTLGLTGGSKAHLRDIVRDSIIRHVKNV